MLSQLSFKTLLMILTQEKRFSIDDDVRSLKTIFNIWKKASNNRVFCFLREVIRVNYGNISKFFRAFQWVVRKLYSITPTQRYRWILIASDSSDVFLGHLTLDTSSDPDILTFSQLKLNHFHILKEYFVICSIFEFEDYSKNNITKV